MMEGLLTWLPVAVSIALFAISMIVIFALRSEDRKNLRLDKVKTYVAQHQAAINQSIEHFKMIAESAEETMAKKQQEVTALVERLLHQQKDIQDHSQDLEELQKTLTYYHEVMGQLSVMTEQAEMRTVQVKQEVAKVEQVRTVIDSFMKQLAIATHTMEEQQTSFERLVSDQRLRLGQEMEASIAEAKTRVDSLLESAMSHTDLSFQTMITTVQAFLGELNSRTALLEDVVARLSATSSETIASLSNALDERRDDLESRATLLEDLSRRRQEMELQIAAMTAKANDLQQEQQATNDEMERARTELDQLHERFSDVEQELQHKQQVLTEVENRAIEAVLIANNQTGAEQVPEPVAETIEPDELEEYSDELLFNAEFDQDLQEELEDYLSDELAEDDEEEEDQYDYQDLDEPESAYPDQIDDYDEEDGQPLLDENPPLEPREESSKTKPAEKIERVAAVDELEDGEQEIDLDEEDGHTI
jgi:chromosome segregation ATPase